MDNKIIRVNISSTRGAQPYEPRFLSVDRGNIRGCGFSSNIKNYLGHCTEELFEERVTPIRQAMEKYNEIVAFLWNVDGFKSFFAEHYCSLTKGEIGSAFGNLVAEKAFSLPCPQGCYPDLIVQGDSFMLKTEHVGAFSYNDKEYTFRLTGDSDDYPSEIDGKICFWNWDEHETDYALYFAIYTEKLLSKRELFECNVLDNFVCYGQWRGNRLHIVEVIDRIFLDMESHGYLEKYKLFAAEDKPIWNYYTGTTDSSVGLYLCDKKAFKDKLLVARIIALLRACSVEYGEDDKPIFGVLVNPLTEEIDITQKYFYLQNEKDETYVSKEPGTFGGHYKLKIYGRLDCPSAARYLAKGQYKQHRVFFADEKTAIEAGYRPCGVCMKEA